MKTIFIGLEERFCKDCKEETSHTCHWELETIFFSECNVVAEIYECRICGYKEKVPLRKKVLK